MDPHSLRERKASLTRAAIADALSAALLHNRLEAIRVEDITVAAKVSRMTFFNYFPSKEAAVSWAHAASLYRLQTKLEGENLRGLPAVLMITRQVADVLVANPDALMHTAQTRRVTETRPELLRLTPADRALLAPELAVPPEQRSFGQVLTSALAEARERGEVQFEGSAFEFGLLIGAALHGVLLVGPSGGIADVPGLMMRHVHRILGLPLDQAAPPPPVPELYDIEGALTNRAAALSPIPSQRNL